MGDIGEACRNANQKSQENKRGAGNTCRFLWRRALNSPADSVWAKGAAASSCRLEASRYIRQARVNHQNFGQNASK